MYNKDTFGIIDILEEYHWSYHICELFLSTAQEQRHF